MGRRGRRTERDAGPQDGQPALNTPFAGLGREVRRAAAARPSRPAPAPPPAEPDPFAAAMRGVRPLTHSPGGRIERLGPAGEGRPPVSDEAEALAALSDLVGGTAEFDISDTREYIEGTIVGLDPRVVRRLRRGDFSWQTHVDLHGMSAAEARLAVDRFLTEAVRDGHRCVLVVHGRGLNSKDQTPVLKERLKVWLARGRAARIVLAFATARPCDGGAGALYVLLRRDRRRRPIEVREGAKR